MGTVGKAEPGRPVERGVGRADTTPALSFGSLSAGSREEFYPGPRPAQSEPAPLPVHLMLDVARVLGVPRGPASSIRVAAS